MGDTSATGGSEQVRGEKLTRRSAPFLGRERAAVSVDVYPKRWRPCKTLGCERRWFAGERETLV